MTDPEAITRTFHDGDVSFHPHKFVSVPTTLLVKDPFINHEDDVESVKKWNECIDRCPSVAVDNVIIGDTVDGRRTRFIALGKIDKGEHKGYVLAGGGHYDRMTVVDNKLVGDKNFLQTGLRELEEEVGIKPSDIISSRIVAVIDDYGNDPRKHMIRFVIARYIGTKKLKTSSEISNIMHWPLRREFQDDGIKFALGHDKLLETILPSVVDFALSNPYLHVGFYVAGGLRFPKLVNEVQQLIYNYEHCYITMDWTQFEGINTHDTPEQCRETSKRDVDGVMNADVFVAVFQDPNYAYRGTFTELGIALGSKKKIYILDLIKEEDSKVKQNVFFYDEQITHVRSVDELKAIFDTLYSKKRQISDD